MQSRVLSLVTCKGVICTSLANAWSESHLYPPSLNSIPTKLTSRRLDGADASKEKVFNLSEQNWPYPSN